MAFQLWAEQNQGQFPTNFDQAAKFLPEQAEDENDLDSFEIVYHGSLDAITNRARTIVLREKQGWQSAGKWAKGYGFADGHSEIHSSADGNFDRWERERMVQPP